MEAKLFNLILAIPALVASLTVHEFAHAWMANRLGDDTARRLGRLTLDPMKHLDPFGTIAFVLGALSGFFFGWAKPVPFNPRNFDHPRQGAMWVALAGPISNILQVPIWLGLLWLVSRFAGIEARVGALSGLLQEGTEFNPLSVIMTILALGVIVNLGIAAFNMIPLPPLDGHYVLEFLGPPAIGQFYDTIRPYSFMILLFLINAQSFGLPDIFGAILGPVQMLGYKLALKPLGFDL